MEIQDYAWNEHERTLKSQDKIIIPSKYKIKITDDIDKRINLEEILETLTQKELAKWAITNARRYINDIDIGDSKLQNEIITKAEQTLKERINGETNAYNVRQAGFLANKLAQKSKTEISKYVARVFAQAIATGHMRGHAIVSSDYAIRVINLKNDNNLSSIIKERDKQIEMVNELERE